MMLRSCNFRSVVVVNHRIGNSPSVQLRLFSSKEEQLSQWQKLKKWLQPFVDGFSSLARENKEAWRVLKKVRSSTPSSTSQQLSRRELFVLRQAPRDLLKSLPLVLFFCIPTIGYCAPLIGYKFPKQTLSWQFWSPSQTTAFFTQDLHNKSQHYPQLTQRIKQINPEQLTSIDEALPFFERKSTLDLQKLSKGHLRILLQTTGLSLFPWLTAIYPRRYMITKLGKRATEISVDDLLLLNEENSIEKLSLSELEFTCVERGLIANYGNKEELATALANWLRMYQLNQTKQYPESFILHAPVLQSIKSIGQ